ncbi:transmembrane protein 26-like [Biomphalaria glabrata]|uniref:Transmembrane protein 26-like n=1 Tax=Biomphalaria glabrata TaxID=6526 RepID=A0A9W2YNG3_BIOGL|nr:transmembrane protein 26-like [Biomphalaria glabrata]
MGYLSAFRAIAVRFIFTCHGVISIWRLTLATHEPRYWYVGLVLCLLFIEMLVTLGAKAGKEWKWFCPSVFIYLMCIVPTIWFLELYELEKRLNKGNSTVEEPRNQTEALSANLGDIIGYDLVIEIPISLTSDEWIRTLEQLLLLILILGRWFLPKGKLTHDQLSQLLLVYIGTAADIVEFFEAFKEEAVRFNKLLCIVILGIWSLSLIQFSLVLTASRVRRDHTGLVPSNHAAGVDGCCDSELYGIMISIFLQDLPFLVLRMLLIFKYYVVSYTNMFFTCKNTIVIILLMYRLVVVHIERKRAAESEEVAAYMLPRYCSSPAIFENSTRRNPKGRTMDSISLSTSNTLSTCSTRASNKSSRTVSKPFGSCNNIYDVRATASTKKNNNYNVMRTMDDLHSPV